VTLGGLTKTRQQQNRAHQGSVHSHHSVRPLRQAVGNRSASASFWSNFRPTLRRNGVSIPSLLGRTAESIERLRLAAVPCHLPNRCVAGGLMIGLGVGFLLSPPRGH